MKIFVPGRLCLFGEHSDWAGGYRRLNPQLGKGYALLVGTNQGLYAEVKPHPTQLIVRASLSEATGQETIAFPMDRNALLAEAEKGGFFSYAAGVAYQFLTHYQVGGLEIDNYLTDLPIQKGLASSAAICVLVARAFNRVYDLKMTIQDEMEFAYLGEIATPSRCGRMDQACAYGNRPIVMTFDGESHRHHRAKRTKRFVFCNGRSRCWEEYPGNPQPTEPELSICYQRSTTKRPELSRFY
jgi:galactokinase